MIGRKDHGASWVAWVGQKVFKSHGDVGFGDMVSGCGGGEGLGLDLEIFEVFSNLNESMVL